MATLTLPMAAQAQYSLSLDRDIHAFPRAAGMAGVGLGFVEDWNAVFINPARLGSSSKGKMAGLRSLSIPALSVETRRYNVAFAGDLANSNSLGEDLGPVLEGLDGTRGVRFRQQFFPNFVYDRFFFGILQSALVNAQSCRLDAPQDSEFGDEGVNFDTAAEVYFRSEASLVTGFFVSMGKKADFGVMVAMGSGRKAQARPSYGLGPKRPLAAQSRI